MERRISSIALKSCGDYDRIRNPALECRGGSSGFPARSVDLRTHSAFRTERKTYVAASSNVACIKLSF